MRIFVDADAFPSVLKNVLIRAVERLHVSLIFVANKPMKLERSAYIAGIVVPAGTDVADDRIAELAQPGDLVITADIPLADRVIAKGAHVIDPRGELYTEDNIKDRLAMRDLMNELRGGGMITGGPAAFANRLNSFLVRHCKN